MDKSRVYTIPGGVQAEAKKALAWRKEHKRGGTPVGLNTARMLVKGGQIGIRKIRHIAKYFPRHSVHKGKDGWKPGDDKFPSNGRIAWALWGGDAGQRWASAIVERENKKEATTAGGQFYEFEDSYGYESEIDAFRVAHELDPHMGPEFMCRIRLDGYSIDRLYKIDIDGQVYLWDGSAWDDMGHVSGDVYSYDKELDDEDDLTEKTHVIIDPSSAVVISAFLQERPFQSVLLSEIDPEEAAMMANGLAGEDFVMIDRVLTASGVAVNQDGNFTPEERAALAEGQPRDATGRFAKVGNSVVIAEDYTRGKGTITAINSKNGTVDVMLENGKQVTVPSNQTKAADTSRIPGPETDLRRPLDLSGILGEPRTPHDMPKAHLPGTMKPLTKDSLNEMLNEGWASWVTGQRQAFNPDGTRKNEPPKKATAGKTPTKQTVDADGNYTVKKNDSLWSIAESTKADGQSTEDQWLKILEANKGKLRSGDPNLIFADEKVAIPGARPSGAKPSAQEAARRDKQDSSRAETAKKQQQQATQEGIRKGKQDESRAARPNAQEAMRQDKQGASKAEAARKSTDAARDALRDARNTDRADTTARGKAAADQKGRDAVRQDKQGASKAEAARKSTDAARDALRDARNTDRADTTARGKAAADQKGRDAVRQDKRATSEAESSATKARAGQEAVRNARNADRLETTAKSKQASDQQVRDASRQDKQAIGKAETEKANAQKGRAATQDAKKSESPAVSKTVADKGQARTQRDVGAAKKTDQPAIRESGVNKARERLREREQNLKQTRNKYGTYRERVEAAERRLADNKRSEGGN